MKLIISFILSFSLHASNLISIKSNSEHFRNALYIKTKLIKEYSIPESLISIVHKECKHGLENNIEFCIDQNQNLEIYKKNSELVSSLKIFNRSY